MAKKKAAAPAAAAPSSAPSTSGTTSVTKRSPPSASSPSPSSSSSSSVGLEYWLAYLFLVHLRLLLCLAGTGYIHPDEYFQSSEPLLGDLLDLPTLRTWEFTVQNPCRSMASVRFWNLPLVIVALLYRWAGAIPTARTLWLVQRVTALVLSLVVDFCWTYLVPRSRTRAGQKDGQRIMQARLLFASSGATLAFLIRPFSNSVETALLAASLSVLITLRRQSGGAGGRQWHLLSAALGGLFALGLFARFTFAIFALPAGLAFLHTCWARAGADRRLLGLLRLSAGAVLGFLGTAAAHIAYDTFYYRSRLAAIDGTLSAPSGLVAVPWNALRYNLSTDNLSEHGIHPHWLHVVVNAPMILGVPIWTSCLVLLYKRMKAFGSPSPPATSPTKSPSQESSIEVLHLASLFLPLVLLSIQPHQEARFLLPLLVPSIALLPLIPPKRLALFSSVHLLQAAGLALFFGVLHQAGVVPALLRINEEVLHFSGQVPLNAATLQALALQGEGSAEGLWLGNVLGASGSAAGVGVGGVTLVVHVWRSFMPPRHLLLPTVAPGDSAGAADLPRVTLIDHGSQTPQDLLASLSGTASKQEQEKHLLLAPTWALDTLLPLLSPDDSAAAAAVSPGQLQLDTLALLSPHVDTDHLSESWSLVRSHERNFKQSSSTDGATQADASRLALLLPEWADNLLAPVRTRWEAISEGLKESFALGVVHVRRSGPGRGLGEEREVIL